jgi:hypothetical protein
MYTRNIQWRGDFHARRQLYTSNMQHRLSNLQGFAGFTGYILYEAVVLLTLLGS